MGVDLESCLGLTFENKVILGEWHRGDFISSHRRYTQREVCTVKELWAAIEEWVNEAGCVCDDLTYTTARLAPLRQRVRDLLGFTEAD